MRAALEALRVFLESTWLSSFMNWSPWAWPVAECLHFVGLSLLIGTVGVFDLRLLGLMKGLSPRLLHRLVPWGIAGFALSFVTGLLFFSGIPGMYIDNPAFKAKLVLLALAGLNVLVYDRVASRHVEALGPDDAMPLSARVLGACSLLLWVGVLFAGRLVAFYKP